MIWSPKSQTLKAPVNWKVNLASIWASQFISLAAFAFCLPFLPIYLRESGIVPAGEVAKWSSILISLASVSMMFFSPMWGTLGDKYGRKMMLIRANLAGGFVLYLMGVIDNLEGLMVLRLLQGAFTGTIPAAQSLVTANTPDKNQGFAIGLIMAAVNAGNMAGNYFGGMCAKYYGPVTSFKIGGIMMFLSTLLVVFLVRENFVRPEPVIPSALTPSVRLRRRREQIRNFKEGLPIFIAICFIAFLSTYDSPYISLYIDDLYRNGEAALAGPRLAEDAITREVYGIIGWVSALSSVAAMSGSIAAGVLMDRKLSTWLWALIAGMCAGGCLWMSLEKDLLGLCLGRCLFLFFVSGLASALVVVLGRMTPNAKKGGAMGWAATVRSVGWIAAPLTGAYLAGHWSAGGAYGALCVLCLLLLPLFMYLHTRYQSAFYPEEEDPPSLESVGGSNVSTPGGQGRQG